MSFSGDRGAELPSTQGLSRRQAAKLLGGAVLGSALSPHLLAQGTRRHAAPPAASFHLTRADEAFLDDLERQGCLFFAEQSGPETGQVLDRAINKTPTGELDARRLASIAATGFGLTALCIADRRGYLPAERIRKQVITTLEFHLNKLPHEHGFFFHFNDVHTGAPASHSEVSSIDTALLLCGVLTARAYFNDHRITDLATRIYNRVDWPWMLNGGQTFSMGWHTKDGFIATRWDHYCELMMIYLLAIGSPTHPVDPSTWAAWTRPRVQFQGFNYISGHDPLFTHQYSQAWFDFRGQRDAYANYFSNSVTATRAHKAFCLSLKLGYTDTYWGVSASDWKHGYTAWGGPPLMGPVDGSVVPYATAGSLPFLPAQCLLVQRSMREKYGTEAWGRYGFCDAFHPEERWYDPDVLGIDLGIGVLMAENLRTGFVWEQFMKNPEAVDAMRRCGFRRV